MATNYSLYEVDANAESIKNEETFVISPFLDSTKFSSYRGLALKLQDLLLLEKGTHPSALDMGVGIRNYLYEFLDDQTLLKLNSEINDQQRKYLPSEAIKRIEFVKSPRQDEPNKLYVFVHLNNDNGDYDSNYFAIGFSKSNTNSSKVLSEVYL